MKNVLKVSIGVAVALVVVGAGLGIREAQKPAPLWPMREFSSDSWKGTPKERRFAFYNDMVGGERLSGLTQEGVEELLGPPDNRALNAPVLGYRIYAENPSLSAPGGVEFELTIEFDATGRVSRVSRHEVQ